jgi:nicotinamide phosphoribosyltransferase
MNTQNLILKTDSYKLSHWPQYPKGMTKIYSYLESRGGAYASTLFFGLQYFLKQLEGVVVTMNDVDDADSFAKAHFGSDVFNRSGWEYIVKVHGGKLPIRIKAVKEGTLVPTHNVLMTIESTDENCFWLVQPLETMLMRVWYPITIATNSFYSKQLIADYLIKTGNELTSLPFKLHDFGYRGVSSEESAGIGGMAHLVNFMGTDTLAAITYANKYYSAGGVNAYSVPASEHSVACSFGKENEEGYFLNMLEHYPTGIVSIVSDTYDVFNFVGSMSTKHKERILSRQGTVVFRPDSGDPIEVNIKLINILWNVFGDEGSITSTGHKLLPPQVRLIQGDGIDLDSLDQILKTVTDLGFSAENWVFGSGGGLLQKFDRDTLKFAIKASYGEIEIGDEDTGGNKIVGFNIQKDPITSSGKKSKAGQLKLAKKDGEFMTITSDYEYFDHIVDEMDVVFENGEIKRRQTFEEIRTLANSFIVV